VSEDHGAAATIDLLVIGYGNELRGDDGVGPKVAAAVSEWNLLRVRAIACPLLTPELAEPISQTRIAVFVDAALDAPTDVRLRQLEPNESSQIMTHAADPRTILALARDVFERAPQAWWLTIPVLNVDLGQELSPLARRGFAAAVHKLWLLCQSLQTS
jgi:hydrogenase maturation protease